MAEATADLRKSIAQEIQRSLKEKVPVSEH